MGTGSRAAIPAFLPGRKENNDGYPLLQTKSLQEHVSTAVSRAAAAPIHRAKRKASLMMLGSSVVPSTCKTLVGWSLGLYELTQVPPCTSLPPKNKWLPDKPCALSSSLLWMLGLMAGQETQDSCTHALECMGCWLPLSHCLLWLLQHLLHPVFTACSLPLLLLAEEPLEHLSLLWER